MGVVYKAEDVRLRRFVALKFLSDELTRDPRALRRFQREARAISALNHQHICTLYDVGPNYLVMELMEGETLRSLIKPGPLPFAMAVQYARQIAEALEAAHEKGIVHRDLKPANIMVTPAGLVKVLDFGLAKEMERAVPRR
jgi:serine/threonine protein kinase